MVFMLKLMQHVSAETLCWVDTRLGLEPKGIQHTAPNPCVGIREFGTLQIHYSNGFVLRSVFFTVSPPWLLEGRESTHCPDARALQRLPEAIDAALEDLLGPAAFSYLPRASAMEVSAVDYFVDVPMPDSATADTLIEVMGRTDLTPAQCCPAPLEPSFLRAQKSPVLVVARKDQLLAARRCDYQAPVTPELLDGASSVLRLHMQCSHAKTNHIERAAGLLGRGVSDFASRDTAQATMLASYDRTVGPGDFYTRRAAESIVSESALPSKQKDSLMVTIGRLSDLRSVPAAREAHLAAGGSRALFVRQLAMLRELGVNGAMLREGYPHGGRGRGVLVSPRAALVEGVEGVEGARSEESQGLGA